jgi:Putative auto-transporter adhesin, head GIN domain
MPRYALPLLLAIALVIALALTWWTLGRAPPASEGASVDRDVEPFHKVSVSGAADVVLQRGNAEHVSIEAPARGARVSANVRDGTLHVSARETRRWWNALIGRGGGGSVRVTVTYRDVDAIALSGAVRLTASGLQTRALSIAASGGSSVRLDGLSTELLRISGDGALKARLAGEATEQRVSISGAAEYEAQDLASERARIDVSGVGHVVVRVAQTLNASISGAGSIEYYGDPKVEQHVSGVGRVKRREATAPSHDRFRIAAAHRSASTGAASCGWPNRSTPVAASRSGSTAATIRTSATRQSASSVAMLATASGTRS